MNELMFAIPQDILTAAIEGMRDLKAYYEADACALARMGGDRAEKLAQERLAAAETAGALYDFFGSL